MITETSLVAEQVRLRQWAAQIQECQNRPSDMKVETWCREHGITKANYYYRLRRVRKACLEVCSSEPVFVELSQTAESESEEKSDDLRPAVILRNPQGMMLEIYNHASDSIVQRIMEVLSHAE